MREAESKVVELPEEDEEVFNVVLTYLYTKMVVTKSPQMLGRIYTAAERYQLDSLKTRTLEKVKSLLPVSMTDWLDLTNEVYWNLTENDLEFRPFFVEYSVKCNYLPKRGEQEVDSPFGTILYDGGLMAVDICKAHVLQREEFEGKIKAMKTQHQHNHYRTYMQPCCQLLND